MSAQNPDDRVVVTYPVAETPKQMRERQRLGLPVPTYSFTISGRVRSEAKK